jgi:hypothetical protein
MDEAADDIRETLSLIGEHLDVGEVFHRLTLPVKPAPGGGTMPAGHTTFRLASMVCYYGQVRRFGGGQGGGGGVGRLKVGRGWFTRH